VDLSKFKTSDWLKVGAGIAMLIFGFVEWVTIEVAGFGDVAGGGNAFDFFFTGTIPWLLVVGTAVVTVLLVLGTIKRGGVPWDLVLLAATALAALLMLIRIVFNPIDDGGFDGIEAGRGLGMWVCFLASLAALAGAFMAFRESGGDINDLKDVNKLKTSFGGARGATSTGTTSSGTVPPPPPPSTGGTPPPPPPPSV